MDIKIDRSSGVPIYIQIKNHIMNEIKNGKLKSGEKLPTERELAEKLNISRNTISNTYNLLEQIGILVSYQGKGTFVAGEAKTWEHQTIKDKILKIIDLALDEALDIGLNTEEFIHLVKNRVKEKEEIIKKVNAIFVECNIEQANVFAKELSQITNLKVVPVVLSQLKDRDEQIEKMIQEAQIIIPTFNHVNEVKSLIGDLNKEIFGVGINPNLETIVKIAKYPKETKFGLISLSEEFHFKVDHALKLAGLEQIDILATISKEKKDLIRLIDASDVLIVSPGREEEVKKLVSHEKEVIRFDYNLDQGSVKAVLSKIMEVMKDK